jgi:outer membrane protein assembly factor BamB
VKPRCRSFAAAVLFAHPLLACASCNDPTGAGVGVQELWSQSQRGEASARPVGVGDLVYFGTGEGALVARDRRTGVARHSTSIANQGISGGNLAGRVGLVVAPTVFTTVAVDTTTGAIRWVYVSPNDTVGTGANPSPGSVIASHIDADDEAVYIPAWGASISAVELATGATRWVWRPGKTATDTASSGVFRSGSSGVRVSGDTVFASVWHFMDRLGLKSEEWVVALDRRSGMELWRVTLPAYTGGVSVFGAPALAGPLLIVATVGGYLWAIDRATQEIPWRFTPAPKFATSSEVEVFDGISYHDGGDDYLYAIRVADGSLEWRSNMGNGATQGLLVTTKYVYYPSGGSLHIVDRADGRRVRTLHVLPAGDAVETPAQFHQGAIYVGFTKRAVSFAEP